MLAAQLCCKPEGVREKEASSEDADGFFRRVLALYALTASFRKWCSVAYGSSIRPSAAVFRFSGDVFVMETRKGFRISALILKTHKVCSLWKQDAAVSVYTTFV